MAKHGDEAVSEGAPRFLSEQYDTLEQQHDAAKLGIWIFLVTEVLLFGGLFCAYAVYRGNHPEIFRYGALFLDTQWGAINTLVLLLSSFTMAMAVRCSQLGDRRGLILHLAVTLFLGVDFLGIKAIEYRHKFHENLVWTADFYRDPVTGLVPSRGPTTPSGPVELVPGEPELGRKLFSVTCVACHGAKGLGASIRGKSLPASEFIATKSDEELIAYIKKGRRPDDPLNTTGLTMLPYGGNPKLTEQDLIHIVSFLRFLQSSALGATSEHAPPRSGSGPLTPDVASDASSASSGVSDSAASKRAVTTRAPAVPAATTPDPRRDPNRPVNAHMFYAIYFGMTGLHGIHVLIGLVVIGWLLVRAVRGDFGPRYFTPVDVGGLYWHLVDLIWIFLFPLFYLIG